MSIIFFAGIDFLYKTFQVSTSNMTYIHISTITKILFIVKETIRTILTSLNLNKSYGKIDVQTNVKKLRY